MRESCDFKASLGGIVSSWIANLENNTLSKHKSKRRVKKRKKGKRKKEEEEEKNKNKNKNRKAKGKISPSGIMYQITFVPRPLTVLSK